MSKYICLHSHFYQPPRENPWLEEIELQDSAYPFHDWNARITAECYARNTASRILDRERRIIEISNNYSRMSFNFGPTLLSWLEHHEPEVYDAILEADQMSQKKFSGHGAAIAQVYNHIIMSLANRRDKETQVVWGIADFVARFGRKPEGMWLAETAVDTETLEILAEQNIRFTILAPRQARKIRKLEDKEWLDITQEGIDTRVPYLCRLPSGKTITLFFYDGSIAQDVAFGGLLNNGEDFANRLMGSFKADAAAPQLVHIATDGETYGHHHRHGEMALAYCYHNIESKELAYTTIYAEYLDIAPPTYEVMINENTSWSCSHGIERWRSDCGCHSGQHNDWNQAWRAPLREAMDWLRDELELVFADHTGKYLTDPWRARNEYIKVILNRSPENVDEYFKQQASRELTAQEKIAALNLLEMQRHAMLMYTSCGWFFDDISGIETTQVIQYAAKSIQLARELADVDLEPEYLKKLESAPSNIGQTRNGATIYDEKIKPGIIDLPRVGAHYAISSLFEEYTEQTRIFCYTAESTAYERIEAGMHRLAIGTAIIRSEITGAAQEISFAVLLMADNTLNGGVREFTDSESFNTMMAELKEVFQKTDIPEVIRLMDKYFSSHNYSLRHLFKDQQRKVLNQILATSLQEVENSFRQIYERNYSIMNVINEMTMPLPRALINTGEFITNTDLRMLLEEDTFDSERFKQLVGNIKQWSFKLERTTLSYVAGEKITLLMENLFADPEDVFLIETIEEILKHLRKLPLDLDLWKVQNLYFSLGKRVYRNMLKRSEDGDNVARKWVNHFHNLEHYLRVRFRSN